MSLHMHKACCTNWQCISDAAPHIQRLSTMHSSDAATALQLTDFVTVLTVTGMRMDGHMYSKH